MGTGIGKRIKEKRRELGLTQMELSKKMGYKSKAAVCKVETGDDNLTSDRVKRFAEALNCTPEYLMGWESNETDELWLEIERLSNDERKELLSKMLSYEADLLKGGD